MSAEYRRVLLLKAAEDLFFENGYAATSLNAILERAGGSKRNFYTEFGGKEGLFKLLVTECTERSLARHNLAKKADQTLEEALTTSAQLILKLFLEPTSTKLYRITFIDGPKFPELVNIFMKYGPSRAINHLEALLISYQEKSEIPETIDCHRAAGHFVAMLRGNLLYEVAMNVRKPPGSEELEIFCHSVVNVFLHGILGRRQ